MPLKTAGLQSARRSSSVSSNPLESWHEEQRSAYLYRACADAEAGTQRADLFNRLAGEAEAQAAIWRAQMTARGHAALHPCHRALGSPEHGAAAVAVAHEAGLTVNVWTVNDPARMIELAAMGVDGIMSDDPERLRGTLASG